MTEFLREPALFPARIAGETWGEHRCDLELAGERFRIEGLSAPQIDGLAARYAARLQEPSSNVPVVSDSPVVRAELDPDHKLPDKDRSNNLAAAR